MTEEENARVRRASLTKKQLETGLGIELLSLCQSVTADGVLSDSEVAELRAWVDTHSASDLAPIAHLRGVLDRVLADGKITQEELGEVHVALESVLPPDLRREAREARQQRERGEREALRATRADAKRKERDERERKRPIGSANFMVAGVRHEGRPNIISRHVQPQDPAILRREPDNKFSPNAIAVYTASGHKVGYMPEDYAEHWAEVMDDGAQVRATFTKVLTEGRSPIPVVTARFYGADARPEANSAAPRAKSSPVRNAGSGLPRWAWWSVIVGVIVVLLAVLL